MASDTTLETVETTDEPTLKDLVERVVEKRIEGRRFPESVRISTLTRLSLKVGEDLTAVAAGTPCPPELADRIREAAEELGVHVG